MLKKIQKSRFTLDKEKDIAWHLPLVQNPQNAGGPDVTRQDVEQLLNAQSIARLHSSSPVGCRAAQAAALFIVGDTSFRLIGV